MSFWDCLVLSFLFIFLLLGGFLRWVFFFFAAIDALKMKVEEEGGGEKKGGGGEEEKMSWLVSAQLWNDGDRSSSRESKLAAAAAAATEIKQVGWIDQHLFQKCDFFFFLISSGLYSESSAVDSREWSSHPVQCLLCFSCCGEEGAADGAGLVTPSSVGECEWE